MRRMAYAKSRKQKASAFPLRLNVDRESAILDTQYTLIFQSMHCFGRFCWVLSCFTKNTCSIIRLEVLLQASDIQDFIDVHYGDTHDR